MRVGISTEHTPTVQCNKPQMRTINIPLAGKKMNKSAPRRRSSISRAAQKIVMQSGRGPCATLWFTPTSLYDRSRRCPVPYLFVLGRNSSGATAAKCPFPLQQIICVRILLFYFSLTCILNCGSFRHRHTSRADPIKREVTSVNRIPTAAAPEKNYFTRKFVTDCVARGLFLAFIQLSAAFFCLPRGSIQMCILFYCPLVARGYFKTCRLTLAPGAKIIIICGRTYFALYYWRLAPRTGIPFYHFSRAAPRVLYFSFCRFWWATSADGRQLAQIQELALVVNFFWVLLSNYHAF